MIPDQGQGACQAIEDAEALRVTLHRCGKDPGEVMRRLALFNYLRMARVAEVIKRTRIAGPRRADDPASSLAGQQPKGNPMDFYWSYHMTESAVKVMRESGYSFEVRDARTGELT